MSALETADSVYSGGFAEPVIDSQAIFRAVLAALAEPALPVGCSPRASAPAPMTPMLASIALALADQDTPVWLDPALAANRPSRAGSRSTRARRSWRSRPRRPSPSSRIRRGFRRLPVLRMGTADYPDRSTTLVVAVEEFDAEGPRFDGSGFRRAAPLPPAADASPVSMRRLPPIAPSFRVASISFSPRRMPLRPCRAPSASWKVEPCTSPSRAVRPPSKPHTGCSRAERRGDPAVPALTLEQIVGQLSLAVDRVMAEGSLYDPGLAALAVKQARGDLIEAIFLVRAYRTTLPRFGSSLPVDTSRMQIRRRISATFKDLPGGQCLGPTFDYTHRLLDPALAGDPPLDPPLTRPADTAPTPRVTDLLGGEGLIEADPSG